MIRVLVFPAEGVNASEIHDALSSCVNVEVWGASSVSRHGSFVFENYRLGLPNVGEDGFYDAFSELLRELGIDAIIPTHDTVVYEFAKNRDAIPAKVLVPAPATAEACRRKSVAYRLLEGREFLPRVYSCAVDVDELPVFAKPDEGQGAKGARVVRTPDELSAVDFSQDVVTEYLPGEEYTVDCFTDRHGKLVCALPRRRARIENGISVRAETISSTPEIEGMAEAINAATEFCGMWFFQVREDRFGKLKLMEISGRCAGTMCASRAKGYNLPLMSVYALMGLDVEVIRNGYEVVADRELASSYRLSVPVERVFIDYDDTLVNGDFVNVGAVGFVYECLNRGIPVTLVTRHEGSLDESLEGHCLSKGIFSSVVHLKSGEPKAPFIGGDEGDIFIDNAFAERKAVNAARRIPVFDASEIPVVLSALRSGAAR